VVVVARLPLGLAAARDAAVELPEGRWRDVLNTSTYAGKSGLGDLLGSLPVALLVRAD
jgi:maltooligosyltrehalose synthase